MNKKPTKLQWEMIANCISDSVKKALNLMGEESKELSFCSEHDCQKVNSNKLNKAA